jgi:hypothetical protein
VRRMSIVIGLTIGLSIVLTGRGASLASAQTPTAPPPSADAPPSDQPPTTPPPPRRAEVGGVNHGAHAGVNGGTVDIGAHANSSRSGEADRDAGGPAGPAARVCVSLPWVISVPVAPGSVVSRLTITNRVEGESYVRYCQIGPDRWENAGRYTYTAADDQELAMTPEAVAELALASIDVPLPAPMTSPATDIPQIVGLPTWLWVDSSTWQPVSEQATAGGLTVTATVTPESITWDMGEGHGKDPVTCDGPGTPYDRGVADELQQTDCSYTYQYASDDQGDGRYHATATMIWTVGWSTSDGDQGGLADITRTTTFDLTVGERQAVVTYGG